MTWKNPFVKGQYPHRKCAVCGERVFVGANGKRRFCSDRCRRAYHRAYQKEWARERS